MSAHAYGGREHDAGAVDEKCLLCRAETLAAALVARDAELAEARNAELEWEAENAALEAEVTQLRAALERIAAHPHGGILVNIAKRALAGVVPPEQAPEETP